MKALIYEWLIQIINELFDESRLMNEFPYAICGFSSSKKWEIFAHYMGRVQWRGDFETPKLNKILIPYQGKITLNLLKISSYVFRWYFSL